MSSLVTLDNGELIAVGPIVSAPEIGIADTVHDKPSTYSAFGSLKTVSETIIGDYRFDLATFEDDHDVAVTGFGRYSIEAGGTGARIVTGALASSSCKLMSKETHMYQAGRGLMVKQSIITGDAGTAGNIREWGLLCPESENGAFLRLTGTTLQWVIKSLGVETHVINSSAWDIPVVHDGYGHIWYIQMEWLGVGDIYLYYDEVLVHTLHHVGTSVDFSIGTPDLKLYYLNNNTSNATDLYLKFGCASVISEGGTSSIRMDQVPTQHALGMLSKGSLVGQDEDGAYQNVAVNSSKELMTHARMDEVQFGLLKELLETNNRLLNRLVKQMRVMSDFNGEDGEN